jgi:hypothetical protein
VADTIVHEIEETQVSAVAWSAILADGAASAALTLVLLAFGAGLGLSVVSTWPGSSPQQHSALVPAFIWL